ncbi:hypothetical protein QP027_11480 [Corynebacterium breve]|uniref:GNAT family N-acetyltransferase n=1 Tax=Corynebacterium breve TaxID=3049799 RepID=A0ABY8VHJ1_9CORY|nr:hypothetical protein [Corynebacterium breve]WIM67684.1 hypothetical protein QP027_11480 [Corynebacterium breve]
MGKATVCPVDYDSIPRVHRLCASSTFWELDPLVEDFSAVQPEVDKEAWLTTQCFHQGFCGFNIVERGTDHRAFATVLFCPALEAPGALRMPTAPVSSDAYLLTSVHIDPVAAHRGWEAVLLDASIMALTERGVPAIEAFGFRAESGDAASGYVQGLVDKAAKIGLAEADTLEGAGFKVIEDHPVIPRLRLKLPPEHGLLTAREIEQLLSEVPARV